MEHMFDIIPDLPISDNFVSLIDIRSFNTGTQRENFAKHGTNSITFPVSCPQTILMIPFRITLTSNLKYGCIKDFMNNRSIGIIPIVPVIGRFKITVSVPEDDILIEKETNMERLAFSGEDNLWYFNGVDSVLLLLPNQEKKMATYTIEILDLKYRSGRNIEYEIQTSSIIVKPGVSPECLEEQQEEKCDCQIFVY